MRTTRRGCTRFASYTPTPEQPRGAGAPAGAIMVPSPASSAGASCSPSCGYSYPPLFQCGGHRCRLHAVVFQPLHAGAVSFERHSSVLLILRATGTLPRTVSGRTRRDIPTISGDCTLGATGVKSNVLDDRKLLELAQRLWSTKHHIIFSLQRTHHLKTQPTLNSQMVAGRVFLPRIGYGLTSYHPKECSFFLRAKHTKARESGPTPVEARSKDQ